MLVNGLADEKLRWELAVVDLEAKFVNLIGDCLVPSAFLSYSGPFVSQYRKRLMNEWTVIVDREVEVIFFIFFPFSFITFHIYKDQAH